MLENLIDASRILTRFVEPKFWQRPSVPFRQDEAPSVNVIRRSPVELTGDNRGPEFFKPKRMLGPDSERYIVVFVNR